MASRCISVKSKHICLQAKINSIIIYLYTFTTMWIWGWGCFLNIITYDFYSPHWFTGGIVYLTKAQLFVSILFSSPCVPKRIILLTKGEGIFNICFGNCLTDANRNKNVLLKCQQNPR